jgi:NitT/TauT family transport system permease protein
MPPALLSKTALPLSGTGFSIIGRTRPKFEAQDTFVTSKQHQDTSLSTTDVDAGHTHGSLRSGVERFDQQWISALVYPVISVLLLLGLWQSLISVFGVPIWLLPGPIDFIARFFSDFEMIFFHALATSRNLFLGFVVGVLIAVPLALTIVSVKTFERGLYPVIVFMNVIPKTIIAPILVLWFGVGPVISVVVVFLMCFFPILVDSMTGFKAVDPRLYYITRSMGASQLQTLLKVKLPASMDHIFSGMKIGIVKAAEGVIIAEFIASNEGLGFMMMRASGFMDMTLLFSGLIAAAIVALIFNGLMTGAERFLTPWARHPHG